MRTQKTWGYLSLLILLCACENSLIDSTQDCSRRKISFTSTIEENPISRAVGTSWEAGDQIGVYMLKSLDQTMLHSNTRFLTVTGNGNFTPTDTPLYYPEDGTEVDFLAYYPYQASLNSSVYKIDITKQEQPKAIDLLYSDNLKKRTQTSARGNLQFYHQLSRLVISFASSDLSDFSTLQASITGIPTQADFQLTTGKLTVHSNSVKEISMKRSGNTAEAILLPAQDIRDIRIKLCLNGKTQSFALPSNLTALEAGISYSFTVNIQNGGSQTTPDKAQYAEWRETPVITQAMLEKKNIHYINHYMPNDKQVRNYSLLYDSDLKIAYWVAYPFCKYYDGKTKRTDAWGFDPEIQSAMQATLRKGFSDRKYDRGHQIPSGDRRCDAATNATTFYYTNMTPQIGTNMNQSIWQELESKVRSWSSGTDTIFIVTGASPTLNATDTQIQYTKDNNGGKIAIPKYYYKALARRIGGQFHTIAFKLENRDYPDRNYWVGAMSVSDLEKLTGFTFFPSLSPEIKAKLDKSKWQ